MNECLTGESTCEWEIECSIISIFVLDFGRSNIIFFFSVQCCYDIFEVEIN